MKKSLFLISIILTGCTAVPIKPKWPNVPEELLKTCSNLKLIETNTSKLSEVIEVVADNYSQYYDCKYKVDDWITWYTGQKNIYNGK